MLISMNKSCGAESIYECDRCKRRGKRDDMIEISANRRLLAHLCDKCYKALERGIKHDKR